MVTPIRHITVHHDGMAAFAASDAVSTAQRIDAIRKAHRNNGWGDIGYHYIIDRAGRVWEGRPLSYQGAHVKDYNEANIGVVVLGNFDEQGPTDIQCRALAAHLSALMSAYNVPLRSVKTHQEWPSRTACPGRALQRYMNYARNNQLIG